MPSVSVVMLGTGTPNAVAHKSGPALAIVVGDQSYLFDAGPGLVRRASLAAQRWDLKSLKAENLNTAFISHLHSDHTAGLSDLILTPWVLGRNRPLRLFGPAGIKEMTHHLLAAYKTDIQNRRFGAEYANSDGIKVLPSELKEGLFYEDDYIKAEAYLVNHPPFEAYAFKISTSEGIIVYSGDTAPGPGIAKAAQGCDLLIHEVYSHDGVQKRTPKWYNYHTTVHTSEVQLANLVAVVQPKMLVLTHQLWMLDENESSLPQAVTLAEEKIIKYLAASFSGQVVSAQDLDLFQFRDGQKITYHRLTAPLMS